jgi:Predicted transcriptional regulators
MAGMTQRELAERIGTSPAYLSQIERGGTKLPGADLRRGIARAFGCSHIDVLIAAGELTREEVESVPTRDDAPGSAEIHRLVDQIDWTPRRVQGVADMLRFIVDEATPRDASTPGRSAGQTSL